MGHREWLETPAAASCLTLVFCPLTKGAEYKEASNRAPFRRCEASSRRHHNCSQLRQPSKEQYAAPALGIIERAPRLLTCSFEYHKVLQLARY
jgi:hypothetical protein